MILNTKILIYETIANECRKNCVLCVQCYILFARDISFLINNHIKEYHHLNMLNARTYYRDMMNDI